MTTEEQMQNRWLDRLRSHEDELTRAERSLIGFMNRHPERAARMTQQDLAADAGVSKPVIISCFRRLGFTSFREFQGSLEQFFATQIDSLSASRNVTERVRTLRELVDEAAAVDARSLERLVASLDVSALETIARRVHDARTVFIIGPSTGRYPAHYVAQRFPRYGVPAVLVPQDERHVPDMLHAVAREDVVLLFHYSDDDTWLRRLASSRGARDAWTALVSATIHPDYVDAVDLFVHVPRGEIGFKNSMAGPMHFANMMLLAYELVFRDEVDRHLTELESTRREHVAGETP